MLRFGLVLLGFLLGSTAAWAQSPPASTAKPVEQLNQRVARHQSEVQHLQKDVSQQESASQQAAERLQQQDRTIAQLREQLKAAQQASKPTAAGH